MLILSRRKDQSMIIDGYIEVCVVDIRGDQVKLGIKAPRNVKVFRREVYEAIHDQNLEAAVQRPVKLPELNIDVDREEE